MTPKLRSFINANYIRLIETDPIKTALLTDKVDHEMGWDLSLGVQYRPLLTDNIIVSAGFGDADSRARFQGHLQDEHRSGAELHRTDRRGKVDDFLYSALVAITLTCTNDANNSLLVVLVCTFLTLHPLEGELTEPLDPGSGPAISVPKDLPRTNATHCQNRTGSTNLPTTFSAKSRGCIECHAGIEPMHASPNVMLGCTDCHGGNATPGLTQRKAHVEPRNPVFWQSSANPNDSVGALNHESRSSFNSSTPATCVAQNACGLCHGEIVRNVGHSMMRHGAMLWRGAV